jgi:hypothetical protein
VADDDQVRFLPRLPLVLALVLVVALRPDLLTASLGSPRALAVIAGVVLTSVVAGLVVKRWSPAGAPWASSLVAVGLLAVLLGPSFFERTVNEDFPPVAPSTTPSASPSTPPAAVTTGPAPSAAASPSPVVTKRPTRPPGTAAPTTAPATTAAKTATPHAVGRLRGIDHSASGRVGIYDLGGELALRFDSVDIQRVPKASVHLVPYGQERPDGGISLGDLKAEKGSFTYRDLPARVDRLKRWTMLVWCDTYATPVAAADLS